MKSVFKSLVNPEPSPWPFFLSMNLSFITLGVVLLLLSYDGNFLAAYLLSINIKISFLIKSINIMHLFIIILSFLIIRASYIYKDILKQEEFWVLQLIFLLFIYIFKISLTYKYIILVILFSWPKEQWVKEKWEKLKVTSQFNNKNNKNNKFIMLIGWYNIITNFTPFIYNIIIHKISLIQIFQKKNIYLIYDCILCAPIIFCITLNINLNYYLPFITMLTFSSLKYKTLDNKFKNEEYQNFFYLSCTSAVTSLKTNNNFNSFVFRRYSSTKVFMDAINHVNYSTLAVCGVTIGCTMWQSFLTYKIYQQQSVEFDKKIKLEEEKMRIEKELAYKNKELLYKNAKLVAERERLEQENEFLTRIQAIKKKYDDEAKNK